VGAVTAPSPLSVPESVLRRHFPGPSNECRLEFLQFVRLRIHQTQALYLIA
jgi:hypothetical protein